MFARTVWSDDVLADTIHDIIHHFKLSSLKVLGTEGSENHKTLTEKLRENHKTLTAKLEEKNKKEKLKEKLKKGKLKRNSQLLTLHDSLEHDQFSLCDTFIEYVFYDLL